jgi:hypothetical protein
MDELEKLRKENENMRTLLETIVNLAYSKDGTKLKKDSFIILTANQYLKKVCS